MERPSALTNYNSYRFLVIFYIVGLAGHFIPFTRIYMLALTPVALLISGITILIPFFQNKELKTFIFFILCGIAGYIAELIGVHYGILFGDYAYGDVLGTSAFGVPLIIAFNWIIIISGSLSLSGILFKNKILIIAGSSVFCVVFDYIMEPVAVFFKYWEWQGNEIPLLNYLTWGALVIVFSGLFVLLKLKVKSKLPAFLLIVQAAYFFMLRVLLYLKILN
jgi:bisanhydrobacterioruberin hydratase